MANILTLADMQAAKLHNAKLNFKANTATRPAYGQNIQQTPETSVKQPAAGRSPLKPFKWDHGIKADTILSRPGKTEPCAPLLFSHLQKNISRGIAPLFTDGLQADYFTTFKPVPGEYCFKLLPEGCETSPTNRGGFLPESGTPHFGKSRAHVAFDWVSFSGKITPQFLQQKLFKLRLFERSATVGELHMKTGDVWEPVATLCIMQGNGQDGWVSVKLDNKQLYQPEKEISKLVRLICSECGIEFKHYNRLDVAWDMQKTAYRNVGCQQFIDKVAKGDYVFKSKKKGTPKVNDDAKYSQMSLFELAKEAKKVAKQVKETLMFEDEYSFTPGVWDRAGKVHTLYVGRIKSGCTIKMYNKSLEMRTQGAKPYIQKSWDDAGFAKGFDTFRFEISQLKDCRVYGAYTEEGAGQGCADIYDYENIDLPNELGGFSKALWSLHFNVAKFEKNTRFSRMKKVDIINAETVFAFRERPAEKMKSHNHMKYMLKSVAFEGLKAAAAGAKIHASELFRFVHNMVERHGLEAWYEKNLARYGFKEISMTYKDWQTELAMLEGCKFVQPEINYRAYEN